MQVAKDIPEKFIQWTLNSFCWFKPNHARTWTILNKSTWSVINKLWLSFQLQSNSSSLLL